MVILKTAHELEIMREAGKIAGGALELAGKSVRVGMTTHQLDTIIHDYIKSKGAIPSFLGYNGFPACTCISINNEVIHGIPGSRKIINGDVISVDVGAFYRGYHGDNAATFGAGEISPQAQRLLDVTKESLNLALEVVAVNARIGDISYAVQSYVEKNGFSVVKKFVGHGVGQNLHESPEVPNFGKAGRGTRLVPGMVIAIEPMVNFTGSGVNVLSDDWTVVTESGSLSAHFEHTVAVTESGIVVLTNPN